MTACSVAQSMTSNQSCLCGTCAGSSHRWTKSWLDEQVGPALRCIAFFVVKEEKEAMYTTVTKNLTWNLPTVSRFLNFKLLQDASRKGMIHDDPSPFGFLTADGEVIQAAEGQDVRIEFFSKGGSYGQWMVMAGRFW